jgi:hypothetical protein
MLGISQTTRKPILLLRLSEVLLLRVAERQLRGLLFQEPPRLGLPAPVARLAYWESIWPKYLGAVDRYRHVVNEHSSFDGCD